MNDKLGVVEFFTMEATEYLERLDGLVSKGDAPDLREFQRLTRALRGAAIMANQDAIAGAAGAFEQLARALKEGARQWDDATRQLATRSVDDLKIFVRRVREWDDSDAQKARDLTAALEAALGRPARPSRAAQRPSGPDAGTRAFIAREGASLASALDRTARTLVQQPDAQDPLDQILNVMQPLRGLASLADLPPMQDLLEGIERAVAEAARGSSAAAAPVFDAAARALSEVTRQVANEGRAGADTASVQTFATMLDRLLGLDPDVVPIDSLFFDDDGPHIVEQGTAPASRERMADVELVSHGEHLKQVADGLDRADTDTQRQLRVQALAGTFRALENAAGTPLADAAGAFARAARAAVATGLPATEPARFAQTLREASNVLSAAAQGDGDTRARELADITAALETGAPAAAPAPAPAPAPVAEAPQRPPAPSAAVPAPAPVPEAPATPAAPAPSAPEAPDLAGSYQRYERFAAAMGGEPASLDDLLAGPPADPGAAAAPAAAPADAGGVVGIDELEYTPAQALERAMELEGEIRDALTRGESAAPLVDELFDLIRIARTPRA